MKKFLLSLFLSFIGLISFCSSVYYGTVDVLSNGTLRVPTGYSTINYTISAGHFLYFHGEFGSRMSCSVSGTNISLSSTSVGVIVINTGSTDTVMELSCNNTYTSYKNLERIDFDISSIYSCPTCQVCQECEECEECQECPTIDTNYCVENNLCPSSGTGGDCPIYTGDGNWSALYINNIQHQSAPLINIDIPDYIYWDYSSSEEEFDLYVGSGYDQDYIDNVIAINSYQPTSEDFTDVFVSGLTLVMPYIVIVLFIIFIRKLIKRIFK